MAGRRASVAAAGGAVEAFFHKDVKSLAEEFKRNVVYNVDHECLSEHSYRFFARYAARLHVEKRLFVELAGGCSMAAFHIVAVDFELR